MRSNYLTLLALVLPVAATAQSAPTEAIQQWARQHVHPISSVEDGASGKEFLPPVPQDEASFRLCRQPAPSVDGRMGFSQATKTTTEC
jgi:hypothetical protein